MRAVIQKNPKRIKILRDQAKRKIVEHYNAAIMAAQDREKELHEDMRDLLRLVSFAETEQELTLIIAEAGIER